MKILVLLDPKLSRGGSGGQGYLAVEINARSVRLFAPSNGYFPDGAVRHEVLHVQRIHGHGVPRLVLAEQEPWDPVFSDALGALDNALEHIVIVPAELQFHPERREHWEAVMANVCLGLLDAPEEERALAGCLHWTFLRHVLPNSPQVAMLGDYLNRYGLLEMADEFAGQVIAVLPSKEEMFRVLCRFFPGYPRQRVAFEYFDKFTGAHQELVI
ncbi:hypothetical protein [Curvibacter sp. AEP1-3]|uniref:hypothetical protein n=1 Tax=Curvibacter sp. AEP1-3 TaxID=1844971 RepID=UPI0012FABC12|nr:hypothetical protein [Curvibacter sp. AEP1-3]